MEQFIQILSQYGITETHIIYGLVVFILIILLLSIIRSGMSYKELYATVSNELISAAETAGVTVESLFDQIFTKIREVLSRPDPKTGKVPLGNRIICIFIAFPLVKSSVIYAVKKHIQEIKDSKVEKPNHESDQN